MSRTTPCRRLVCILTSRTLRPAGFCRSRGDLRLSVGGSFERLATEAMLLIVILVAVWLTVCAVCVSICIVAARADAAQAAPHRPGPAPGAPEGAGMRE